MFWNVLIALEGYQKYSTDCNKWFSRINILYTVLSFFFHHCSVDISIIIITFVFRLGSSWNVPSFASGFNIEPEWYLWYCARYSVWVPNCETIETYPITNLRKKFVFVHESLFVNKDTRILNFYFYWFQLYFFS